MHLMSNFLIAVLALIVALVLYFVSSGVAFVAMHKIGARFPSRLASLAYAPLEWLSRKSGRFRKAYNGLHTWFYKRFVGPTFGA